jgi:hypothetical protein
MQSSVAETTTQTLRDIMNEVGKLIIPRACIYIYHISELKAAT